MLKIGVARADNIVLGCVLEQSDLPCGQDTLAVIEENECIDELSSIDSPALLDDVLFVRGDEHDKDNDFFAYAYGNEEVAKEAIEDIKRLVAKVNRPEAKQTVDNLAVGLTVIE